MKNPINLTEHEINQGVIEMLKKINMSGSFSKDNTYIDLYKLIQHYLLNIDKRVAINELLNFPKAAILPDIDIENIEFEFDLKANHFKENNFKDNVIHYLKLKDLGLTIKNYDDIYQIILYYVKPEVNTHNTIFKIQKINRNTLTIKINDKKQNISLKEEDVKKFINSLE